MDMPEGWETLVSLVDPEMEKDYPSLDGRVIPEAADLMKKMALAIQKFEDEYSYGDSAESHLALKEALKEFKEWK